MCLISLANTRKLQIRGKMKDIFIVLLSSFAKHLGEKYLRDGTRWPPAPLVACVSALLTETSFQPGKAWISPATHFSNKGASFFSLESFSALLQRRKRQRWVPVRYLRMIGEREDIRRRENQKEHVAFNNYFGFSHLKGCLGLCT